MDSGRSNSRARSIPRTAVRRPYGMHGSIDGFAPAYRRQVMVPSRQTLQQFEPTPKPATIPEITAKTKSEPSKSESNSSAKTTAPSRKKSLRRLFSKKVVASSLAGLLVIFSVYVSVDGFLINQKLKATNPPSMQNSVTPAADTNTPAVDETPLPPNALDTYKVSSSLPRIIRIDSIGVAARVLRMGITTDNLMDTPKGAYDTGWYDGSAKPGEAGAMVINGHYSGLTQPAIFQQIGNLKAGAIITIERGDGKVFTYAAQRVEKMSTQDVPMEKLLISSNPNAQSLNLITCSGTFNQDTQTFDQRTIVYAVAKK